MTPPPPSKPPRSAMTIRDMLFALVVLAVLVLLVGGLTRSCSFAPAGPTVDASRLPVVDAPARLTEMAAQVAFPVRVPAVPADWRSNSADRDVADGAQIVRVGYLTPQGRYLRLLQSDASEEQLLARETGVQPVSAQGVLDVAGQRWVSYRSANEAIWTTELPGEHPIRLLITGSADENAFRTLATATTAT